MNRLHKRRIDNTKKRSRVNLDIENIWAKAYSDYSKEKHETNEVHEGFTSGCKILITDDIKTYNTEDLPPNRMITFETDTNDVWEYSKTD